MADRATAGREFLKGVLQHLPDDLRAAMEAHIADGNAAAPLLTYAGDGALRQSEFSAQMDAVRKREQDLLKYRDQLDDYRKELEAAAGSRPNGDPANPNPNPSPGPNAPVNGDGKYLTQEQLENLLNRRETYYANFTADMTKIAAEHQKHFGEVLDSRAILAHPRLAELGLEGAWKDLHKPKFEKLAADHAAAERERIRKEIRAEIQAEQSQIPAYPIAGGSPLDGMGGDASQFTPEAAARAYNELVRSPG